MKNLLKPHYKKMKIYGLRGDTCLTLLWIFLLLIPVIVFGRLYKLQENRTAHYFDKGYTQEQKIKELTTYKQPELGNVSEQQKARAIIRKVWRNDYRVGIVLAVCESGLREKVVNSIGATGYFQINAPVHNVPIEEMRNGFANAGYAYALYNEQGLTPWVSSESCWGDKI